MVYNKIFKKFSFLEGSQHIASENALKGIEKLIKKNKIKSVFEFGIGIGTIPYLVKTIDRNISYVGTEDNDFCIKAFNENLGLLKDENFHHLLNFKDIGQKFDLVIVDGTFKDERFLKSIVHSNSIIFIEGDRKDQRTLLNKIFPEALVSHVISLKRNYTWSPFKEGYQGGYTIYRLNNKKSSNIIYYFREKVSTSLKYRLRRLIN
ncbi:hypothetical protein [Cecembia rubra]|uniref:Methyltransferase family protein n=1 Tax=Cecembia rubra TaxID=1485585 RepID=A0A2P8E394_9BACT|nr:hypothetical protein [Cecembia rubra]PSL03951.1 hypothetical protein CLV48_106192 [Cecembia rubra]